MTTAGGGQLLPGLAFHRRTRRFATDNRTATIATSGAQVQAETLLGDRYRVRSVLGEGSMSVVLLATDLRLDRDVAVKVLRTALLTDAVAVARFRREADDACVLDHPGIVGVLDTGENDTGAGPVPYLVVEYVAGPTLRAVLAEQGPLPVVRALEITSAILGALEFAHRHGVLHRHLSATTVLLGPAGPKVMDFGVGSAAFGRGGGARSPDRLRALQYASPEQLTGGPVDARSDVYSVGCLLQEMLTGHPPFTAGSPIELAEQHVRTVPAEPGLARPDVPVDVDAIVGTATQRPAPDRYQTAREMRSAVDAALRRELLAASAPIDGDSAGPDTSLPGQRSPHLLTAPVLTGPTWLPADTDPAPASGPRRWGRILVGALCALLLGGAAVLTLTVLTAPPPASLVAVPDLSGRTLQQATEILRGRDLVLGTVTRVESTNALKDKVVGQRPSELTQVDPDTVVSVEIGRGVTVVAVPDLSGSTAAAARTGLTAVRLGYSETLRSSSDADRGKVIAQDPKAGAQVPPGRTVTVTIGTGLNLVAVPDDLIGKDIGQVRDLLRSAGLTLVTQQGDGAAPLNQVIGVDQPAGRQLPQGTPVTVTVSNNLLLVMPALQGRPQDAVAVLRSLGWAGDLGALAVTGQPTTNAAAVGTIVSQDPAPGTEVRKIGTPVRLGIGVRQLVMPALTGRTQQQAARTLAKAGATNVSFVDAGRGTRGQVGRVATQSVPAGTAMAADAPIVLSVFSR